MKLEHVKSELWRIGKTYSTLGGLLQKELPHGGTVGTHWAGLMVDLDAVHFENVTHEYAVCERELPLLIDRLCIEIIREVNDRAAKDAERQKQHEKYYDKGVIWRQPVSRSLFCRVIKYLLAVKTTKEQGDAMAAWAKGTGEPPDWLTDSQKRSFFPGDFETAGVEE